MSYRIDPSDICVTEGCRRPKATGETVCSQCSRLARATGRDVKALGSPISDASLTAPPPLASGAKAPRCVAYLSMAGDVITLELTGEPRFTEADVEAVAAMLSNRRKAA
jgi:hypothetical protein